MVIVENVRGGPRHATVENQSGSSVHLHRESDGKQKEPKLQKDTYFLKMY